MPIVTLTSDFGSKDPDLAVLKSGLLKYIPAINLIDITHDIVPFDKEEAIYILKNSLLDFPEKTIHIIALESEVFSGNKPVLIQTDKHYFLTNNNGIVPTILDEIDYNAYYLDAVDFESFMRVHIEALVNINEDAFPTLFTEKATDLKKLNLVKPVIDYKNDIVQSVTVRVIYTDHYGNSVFNLTKDEFEEMAKGRDFKIRLRFGDIITLRKGYNDFVNAKFSVLEGNIGARFNHFNHFEIFVNGSNHRTGGANTLLGLKKGENLRIIFE